MTLDTSNPTIARPIVLIVDDSPDVHRLLKARLRVEDLDVLSAEDGPAGIEIARQAHPSLILLDLDMPVMDGYEVLRTLKEDQSTMNIPVIILSGLQNAQDKVTAFDLGAIDYVTKPFDIAELKVRVRSALRMQQLIQMLSQRAQIDGLSGLWNRRYFDTRWTEEVSRGARHGRALSVAILDLDHFKSINDTYGHPAGDAAIQGMAKILQAACRQSDVACRYGGEEFVLIMTDTAPKDALVLCERIRASLEGTIWPMHPDRRVTISIGVAGSAGACDATPDAWLHTADQNLYTAKKSGRNRIVCSELPTNTTGKLRAAG
ncbi:MAG: diguanylate cyclase [Phycisphaerales bacterium]|nr:diguanylate cyclase [Phycisphaerales bacterium]